MEDTDGFKETALPFLRLFRKSFAEAERTADGIPLKEGEGQGGKPDCRSGWMRGLAPLALGGRLP